MSKRLEERENRKPRVNNSPAPSNTGGDTRLRSAHTYPLNTNEARKRSGVYESVNSHDGKH